MEWFIIVLALGVAIGPILYLMPSDRDRYISGLRALARKLGYTVQLDKVPKLDPSSDERVTAGGGVRQPAIACARYQLPLGVTLNNLTPITLLRIPAQATVPVERLGANWGILAADLAQQRALANWRTHAQASADLVAVLGQLPDDVLAVQFEKRLIAGFWSEQSPAAADSKNQSIALFWPRRKPKSPQTLAEFPRLQLLDTGMRCVLNAVKKHWGVSAE